MRTVSAHLFSSLDGVVSDPHLFQFDAFGPEEGEMMGKALAPIDEAVMGRVIFQEWADYWPAASDPFGQFINPLPKKVASRNLSGPLSWENSSLIEGDLVEFVQARKESEGGEIALFGISVIAQLLDAGLLDSLTLTTHPVLAGEGKRISDSLPGITRLTLLDHQITSVGNAILTYGPKAQD